MEVAVDKLGMPTDHFVPSLFAPLCSVFVSIQALVLNEQLWPRPVLKLRMLAPLVHEGTLLEIFCANRMLSIAVVACRGCLVSIVVICVTKTRSTSMVLAQ